MAPLRPLTAEELAGSRARFGLRRGVVDHPAAVVLVFGLVLIGLGLVLMIMPGPGAMLLFPGAVLVIAAPVLLQAGGRRGVSSLR